jgi:hypothetical protein
MSVSQVMSNFTLKLTDPHNITNIIIKMSLSESRLSPASPKGSLSFTSLKLVLLNLSDVSSTSL